MRTPRPEWIAALRRLEGCSDADIRWNESVGRWEFILAGADGVPRSQFYGRFDQPVDAQSGLYPFRELDDDGMREVLQNLERTYIANRFDGAGTTRREVGRRYRFNRELLQSKYREAGALFADLAAERGRRIRGATLIHVPIHIGR